MSDSEDYEYVSDYFKDKLNFRLYRRFSRLYLHGSIDTINQITRFYNAIKLHEPNNTDQVIRDFINFADRHDYPPIFKETLLELRAKDINSIHIQSRFRGYQTRKKIKTQKAYQKLRTSQLPIDNEVFKIIEEYLSRMPYYPDVTRRIEEEERQHKELVGSGKKKQTKRNKQKRRG
jgi:hypothetical protein